MTERKDEEFHETISIHELFGKWIWTILCAVMWVGFVAALIIQEINYFILNLILLAGFTFFTWYRFWSGHY